MQLQAYFEDIQEVILTQLGLSEKEILVAVAWFTDRQIFEQLCKKARSGVSVKLAVLGDEINLSPYGLNFSQLENLGGKVHFLPDGSQGTPIMHHKFCVLDQANVITGSYNWSKKAQSNNENITLVTHAPEFAHQYRTAFYELIGTRPEATGSAAIINTQAVKRRLEMIRNLILLGEQEDLPAQIQKLRPLVHQLHLEPLLTSLEGANYQQALEWIEDFIHRMTALVVREDLDLAKLKFELQILEVRLQSISDEKSDLERRLVVFNRRYNDALGKLVTHLLAGRAILANKKAQASKQEASADAQQQEEAAEEAKQDWRDYRQEYEEQQSQEAPSRLTQDEEKELKKVYRQACSLCHPDRYGEEEQEAAHQAFVVLQEIYKSNDLSALKDFYSQVKAGGLSQKTPRSSSLSQADTLRAAIAELHHRISQLVDQLEQLKASDGVELMSAAGESEEDWEEFFNQQRKLINAEIQQLKEKIAAYE